MLNKINFKRYECPLRYICHYSCRLLITTGKAESHDLSILSAWIWPQLYTLTDSGKPPVKSRFTPFFPSVDSSKNWSWGYTENQKRRQDLPLLSIGREKTLYKRKICCISQNLTKGKSESIWMSVLKKVDSTKDIS